MSEVREHKPQTQQTPEEVKVMNERKSTEISTLLSSVERVEYTDVLGQRVSLGTEVVRQLICPKATPFEAVSFLLTARALGANPFLRQIYLIKYDDRAPASIVVSRDFFLHLAHSQSEFLGMESGTICLKPRRSQVLDEVAKRLRELFEALQKAKEELPEDVRQQVQLTREQLSKLLTGDEAELVDVKGEIVPPGYRLFGGWAKVFVKDERVEGGVRVVEARVMLSEYNREQSLWKTHPATMIVKVAEAHALRRAFPLKFAGAYMPEEVGESDEAF